MCILRSGLSGNGKYRRGSGPWNRTECSLNDNSLWRQYIFRLGDRESCKGFEGQGSLILICHKAEGTALFIVVIFLIVMSIVAAVMIEGRVDDMLAGNQLMMTSVSENMEVPCAPYNEHGEER